MSHSQLVTDALQWRKDVASGNTSRAYEDTASACLARVTVMLGLYGSKPEAILNVIHDHGYVEVTLADVIAVRNRVLDKQ